MKKFYIALVVVSLVMVTVPAFCGPIDWMLGKLGVVKDSELEIVKSDISSVRKDVVELSSETNSRIDRLVEREDSNWNIASMWLWSLTGIIIIAVLRNWWCRISLWWCCKKEELAAKKAAKSQQPPEEDIY